MIYFMHSEVAVSGYILVIHSPETGELKCEIYFNKRVTHVPQLNTKVLSLSTIYSSITEPKLTSHLKAYKLASCLQLV